MKPEGRTMWQMSDFEAVCFPIDRCADGGDGGDRGVGVRLVDGGAYALKMTPDERPFWFWQVVGIASLAASVVLCCSG